MNKAGKILSKGMLQTLIIIAAGILTGLAANSLRADRLELAAVGPRQPVQAALQAGKGPGSVTKISIWEGFKIFRSGKALFMDARSEYDFNAGHIPKAVNVHPGKGSQSLNSFANDKKRLVVIYCQSAGCHLAEDLAKELLSNGFADLKIMTEGWEAWSQSGYPVESGR